ncbi:prephenate dehydrogenase/arogenate dehydrogenase family protein [Amycolatopsis cihanbeyliensis]|uniref:Prephenate dehydrogenase n=1 Tax=Amycolatopsis cihanbeyliensis TaxID=1128664 RepID=A0A542DEZ1_AMYCI|nr:prephenate dehydrogenase/arogenate dehydrogenase family protein [Amycolatopsis cihanbeyliensis]TQJ01639.1 prephenate dehydrogenase [Amycolatopsis cihanbeyliensis]
MSGADAIFDHVVVLGGGAVGMLVVETLRGRSSRTTVVDLDPAFGVSPGDGLECVVADVTSQDDLPAWVAPLREASVIVLSLPETVVKTVLLTLATHASKRALVVETCSVKADVAAALGTFWSGRPALGINPLFRPSLGIDGRRVAIVSYERGGHAESVEEALSSKGALLVRLGAAEHDRLAAITQALAHASLLVFGVAVAECRTEVSVDDLMGMAPPPFRALLSLSARVAAGDVAVYRAIQDAPGGHRIRTLMTNALADLDRAVSTDAGFEGLQTKIRDAIGPTLVAELVDTSDALLSGLR